MSLIPYLKLVCAIISSNHNTVPRVLNVRDGLDEIDHARAVARLSTVGGGKGGAIEKFLVLEKFAKILENFEQNFLKNFE